MFQKLARAVVIAASLVLVISRMAFPAHAATIRPLQADKPSAQNVFIVSQLQIRRS